MSISLENPKPQSSANVCILFCEGYVSECQSLAQSLKIPVIEKGEVASERFILEFDADGVLGIVDSRFPRMRPVVPEFERYQSKKGSDPLMRAIGYKTTNVIDCTAGWASDAAHIARNGVMITAVERNPIVYALINNALCRSENPKIKDNLSLHCGDSLDYLRRLEEAVEVIYIDPMYPPKPGSAAPKKSLTLLQQLLTVENDPEALVDLARQVVGRRVVVKRPHYAEPLAPGKSGEIIAKLVRFDLYPPYEKDA